ARTKVLLTSIASIAMCASIAVGGTYALFTDEAVVNVAVTSGTVDVEANVVSGSLKTYSRGILQADGHFANDATGVTGAVLNADGSLTLTNVTPGDKAEFEIAITNNSNVDIQYRTVAYFKEGSATKLSEKLVWTSSVTDWTYVEGNTTIANPVKVSVELPETVTQDDLKETADAEIKSYSATILFTVEAVQGNGVGEYIVLEDSDFETNPVTGKAEADIETLLDNADKSTEKLTITLGENQNLKYETKASHDGKTFTEAQDVTIQGAGATKSAITFTGDGVTDIRAGTNDQTAADYNEYTLTIKDVTIIDESESYAEGSWEFGYLEFGGPLYFENVVFKGAIQISEDAKATFVNCTFEGMKDSEYGVWVDDGNVTFTCCTFQGPRGLKMHEAYGSNVETVVVDNCLFDNLSKKPGIAIGTLEATTVVTIKNSTFDNCQPGDQGLYMYETDTDVTTFNFTEENNTVIKASTGFEEVNGEFHISTKAGLFAFAKSVNEEGESYAGKTVKLTANIDLNNQEWTPVGQTGGYYASTYFQGTFDGQGHTIKNLQITKTDPGKNYAVGLFGFIDAGAADIKNVKVDTANVTGHHWTGVIVGFLTGTITNCEVTNTTLTCTHANDDACGDKAGLIVGYINNGLVSGCTVSNSTVSAGRDAGQVVGASQPSQVTGCSATNVTVSYVGGCTDSNAGGNIRNEVIGRIL
ncbi:MAG: right-handed parallel beta-helix repeat-containing protein, partial [Clostridia bacterium]|nr:right-handed parallel beta-helix repeat-containing protein [Clostridia bacterium]